MLRWQLKNVRNRHLLWLKLLACSFAIHMLFVMMLFFGYRDGSVTHTFTMHNHSINTHIAIVLVPTMQKTNASTTSTQQTIVAKRTDHSVKVTDQKKAATQVAQPKPAAAPKKVVPAKATPAKTAPVKAVQKKATPSVAKAIANKPKNNPKKVTPAKKVVPAKVEPVKTIPIKTPPAKVEPAKSIAIKNEPIKPESNTAPNVATNAVENEIKNVSSLSHNLCVDDGPVTVEVPYGQAREFYQQEALRKELSRHWTPPLGVPETCICEITTYVGNNGVVTDSVITQSSGILMYDVSARAAILAMNLPRWTWGSSFAITFKP